MAFVGSYQLLATDMERDLKVLRCLLALENVDETNSRNEKKEFIRNAKDHSEESNQFLRWLFFQVHDPFVDFGIRSSHNVGEVDMDDAVESKDGMWDRFQRAKKLFSAFQRRTITGNEARDKLDGLFSDMCDLEKKWYKKTVNRYLRCGVGYKTVSDIYPDLLRSFGLQKASDYGGFDPEYFYLSETKFDGYRLIFVPRQDGDGWRALSSSGKPLHNTELVEEELKKLDPKCEFVHDGEAFSKSWNHVSSIVTTESEHEDREDLVFKRFDCIPFEEWSGEFETILIDRKGIMHDQMKRVETEYVEDIDYRFVETKEEINSHAEEIIEDGGEGTIIKNPLKTYSFSRGDGWSKVKIEDTYDMVVVEGHSGNGRLSDTLGSVTVVPHDSEVRKDRLPEGVHSNVGGGFSDSRRDDFWEMYQEDELKGTVIEVDCLTVTPDGRLREPRFKRLREDKH